MSADRKAAVWIGVLYIIGTVVFVLSWAVTGGVLTGPAYLARVAAQPNQVAVGALLVLLAGFALAMVPVVFWPVGKRHNETLAMGYVVFRDAIETVLYMLGALAWLTLIALSTVPDPASDQAHAPKRGPSGSGREGLALSPLPEDRGCRTSVHLRLNGGYRSVTSRST